VRVLQQRSWIPLRYTDRGIIFHSCDFPPQFPTSRSSSRGWKFSDDYFNINRRTMERPALSRPSKATPETFGTYGRIKFTAHFLRVLSPAPNPSIDRLRYIAMHHFYSDRNGMRAQCLRGTIRELHLSDSLPRTRAEKERYYTNFSRSLSLSLSVSLSFSFSRTLHQKRVIYQRSH